MKALKEMVGSKKAITGVVTVIVNLIVGFLPADKIDNETKLALITAISGVAASYLVGQGIADHGKEARKLDAAAATTGSGGDAGE